MIVDISEYLRATPLAESLGRISQETVDYGNFDFKLNQTFKHRNKTRINAFQRFLQRLVNGCPAKATLPPIVCGLINLQITFRYGIKLLTNLSEFY